jgi:hypothetical protein
MSFFVELNWWLPEHDNYLCGCGDMPPHLCRSHAELKPVIPLPMTAMRRPCSLPALAIEWL